MKHSAVSLKNLAIVFWLGTLVARPAEDYPKIGTPKVPAIHFANTNGFRFGTNWGIFTNRNPHPGGPRWEVDPFLKRPEKGFVPKEVQIAPEKVTRGPQKENLLDAEKAIKAPQKEGHFDSEKAIKTQRIEAPIASEKFINKSK